MLQKFTTDNSFHLIIYFHLFDKISYFSENINSLTDRFSSSSLPYDARMQEIDTPCYKTVARDSFITVSSAFRPHIIPAVPHLPLSILGTFLAQHINACVALLPLPHVAELTAICVKGDQPC